MARKKSATRGDKSTRERMLDAGLKTFAQKGFVGATTKEISSRAGVNEVTLFRHFGSKEGLYSAVISERHPTESPWIAVAFDDDASADELLRAFAASLLSALRANRYLFMILMGDVWRAPKTRTVIERSAWENDVVEAAKWMGALMEAGKIRRMDSRIAARTMIGMVQSYFLSVDLLADRTPDPAEDDVMLSWFVEVFLDGIRAGGRR
ncbi:MAG: TetR/AcrR family transcriptional regulator [Methanobacteriota archaeon]|nr:MAG: TetR/AcrR family transcriptional regulator [Euryarchaeota archaeon]